MCYIARHRGRPGAYAIVVDDQRFPADTADCVRDWLAEGAIVERVTRDAGVAELDKYVAYRNRRGVQTMVIDAAEDEKRVMQTHTKQN